MYEDVLKDKDNMGTKLIQGEEEKKKLARENELLARKVSENTKVGMMLLSKVYVHVCLGSFVAMYPLTLQNLLTFSYIAHLTVLSQFFTKEIEKFRQKLKTMQTDHAKLQTAYDDRVNN